MKSVEPTFAAVMIKARKSRRVRILLAGCLFLAVVWLLYSSANHPSIYTDSSDSADALQEAALSVAKMGKDGRPYVLMTAATYGYREFVSNLHCSVRKYAELLVISLDESMHKEALEIGLNSVLFLPSSAQNRNVEGGNKDEMAKFGSKQFQAVTYQKLHAVRSVLALGIDVIFSDGDIFWCRSPSRVLDYIHTADGDSDIITQYTEVISRERINSGLYFTKSTPKNVRLFDTLISMNEKDDQVAINRLLCKDRVLDTDTNGRVKVKYCRNMELDVNVTASFLPEKKFPLGCTKFNQIRMSGLPPRFADTQCKAGAINLLHFSCWGAWNKKAQMAKRGMWLWDETSKSCTN